MTKLLLCDVDGTLTETVSGATFKQNPRDVKVMEGVEAVEAVEAALNWYRDRDWHIVGISNQGGCAAIDQKTGKPFKTIEDAIAEMAYTLELLPQLQAIYFCPDFKGYFCYKVSKDGITKYDHSQKAVLLPYANYDSSVDGYEWKLDEQLNFRKPGAGMINLALKEFDCDGLNMEAAWMVGDREEDKEAASNALIHFCPADLWRSRFTKGIKEFTGLNRDLIWFLEGVEI
ncbi:hypothetical protein WA1_18670 [Scytonema hofmannii PCC 7110]|uniref:D,D-heptose 1,7-bisphosphate phosphatase n=1 Tax=Scytonema hofmannii PCC 7110 TaxID=128403 RepID=A0A139XBE1_9CYAN|nr:HAD hydrolase-like protein [Scytonema hofmannii]KYC42028.1 hypothetical protein WA1_18670 [Scytonema hofmannii PCC 7110]